MHPIVNIATKAARIAGKTIMQSMNRLYEIQVSEKIPNDFVTEVDKLAEQQIIETILAAHPDHSILAEESAPIENAAPQWIIDPLDGTANFIHGFPHFAISIAFRQNNKIEHGVIYDPVAEELFTASRGQGAKLNNKRIRVSDCIKIEKALIGTGLPFKRPKFFPQYMQAANIIYPQVSDIRRTGSAALDLAYLAAGRLDGYWEQGIEIWDIAAGVLMVKEAGGFISDFEGSDEYFTNGNVIAGTPKIFASLSKLIAKTLI